MRRQMIVRPVTVATLALAINLTPQFANSSVKASLTSVMTGDHSPAFCCRNNRMLGYHGDVVLSP
jgi:hypothetical protein